MARTDARNVKPSLSESPRWNFNILSARRLQSERPSSTRGSFPRTDGASLQHRINDRPANTKLVQSIRERQNNYFADYRAWEQILSIPKQVG
jgi:hypothetical protein